MMKNEKMNEIRNRKSYVKMMRRSLVMCHRIDRQLNRVIRPFIRITRLK
jgi:hypothetical protein